MPKILIADDSRFQVETLSLWLSPKGFEVVSALDAFQTWTFALRVHPDVILLDINMPAGNGIDILRKLKASPKTQHVPVIVMTGDKNPATEAEARELGAAEFLHKPLEQDLVCAAVDKALAPKARSATP
jgi:two-component system, cell cycle response regulator